MLSSFWELGVHPAQRTCSDRSGRGDEHRPAGHAIGPLRVPQWPGHADFREAATNDDGSVDLYFGPNPPNGKESNWIQTIPNKHWFAYTRFYGPLEPYYFDHTWKLGDITAR